MHPERSFLAFSPARVLVAAAVLALTSGCVVGDADAPTGYDYDRQLADPFSYSAQAGASATAAGGTAAPAGGAEPVRSATRPRVDGDVGASALSPRRGDGFDARVEEARRNARLAGSGQAASPVGAAPSPAETRVTAAERRRQRFQAETPSPGRTADDIEHDRRAAVRNVRDARRSAEISNQRRQAGPPAIAAQGTTTGPGSRAAEANRRFHDRARDGFTTPSSARRRAAGASVPDVGSISLP